MKIASPPPQRKNGTAGEKVEKRFFFDRIDGYRGCLRIIEVIEYAVFILIHPANACFAGSDTAPPLAGVTAYSCIGQFFIEQSLMHN
jgi:hypothetical protein